MEGEVCPHCEVKIFPPRDICPSCKGETKEKPDVDWLLGTVLLSSIFDEEDPKCRTTVMVKFESGDIAFGYLPRRMGNIPIDTIVRLDDPVHQGLKTVENEFKPVILDMMED